MARKARLIAPGYPVHVVHRGCNRAVCFQHHADLLMYLGFLREHAIEGKCTIHAYCLMSNHIHLLATPENNDGISIMMKGIAQGYAQYFNKRYERSGPLWEGRYKSSQAFSQRYVLACYRYIELNPVRAGMVRCPEDYAWSSYRTNALNKDSSIIVPHGVYLDLAPSMSECKARYRELVNDALDQSTVDTIRDALRSSRAMGSKVEQQPAFYDVPSKKRWL